jgi:NAD(P)H-dependent FMN reductase
VKKADGVVLASPVYRATYTGILKNFLDLLPIETLEGKPVGIVAMGGSNHNCLGVDWQLRCTLSWFGAIVAPTSVYLTPQDFSSGKPTSRDAIAGLKGLIGTLAVLSGQLHSEKFRPRPLAAIG